MHAGSVLECRLGLNRAVGDDLGEVLGAVLFLRVLDDSFAQTLVEVDVDVRRRVTFGVEEPLEQQPVLERIDVGDVQHVRQQRTGRRATTRADADAVVLGPPDHVADDQEVRAVTLLGDDLEFPLQLVAVLLCEAVAGEPGRDELLDLVA